MSSDTSTEPSPLFAARMAGALWLIVILASIVAVVGGASLDLRGDSATLAANALASAPRIRLAFVMLFFGKICYLGGTVLLYELLKPVNKSVALFGAFCGLAGLLSGAHGLNQLTALSLLEESRRATEPVASQLQGAVKIFLAPGFSGEGLEWLVSATSSHSRRRSSPSSTRRAGSSPTMPSSRLRISSHTNGYFDSALQAICWSLRPMWCWSLHSISSSSG